ncbi:MAG: hypothetical protein ACT4P7_13685 [Gemmatimonadaceae bacterium]
MPRPRRGIALLTTLTILILLLLMTTGVLHLAIGDARRANDGSAGTIAGSAADAGAYSLLRDWSTFNFDSMQVGDTIPSTVVVAGDATALVRGRRVSPLTWWITAFGFTPDSISVAHTGRRVNLVLRQAIPDLATIAAFTVRDSAQVVGSGAVVGADSAGGIWALGCPASAAVAGIAIADTTMVQGGNITGAPPLRQDPLAALPSTYTAFGPDAWAALAARASIVLPAGSIVSPAASLTGGRCNVGDPANWGEPAGLGPCAWHAPLIWVRGSVEVRGGRGQGILLADGDVTLSQGAAFLGVVIARDDLLSGVGGGSLLGAALAADSLAIPGDHSRIGDGLRIQRSTCAVSGVLRRNARLIPVAWRSWAPMW